MGREMKYVFFGRRLEEVNLTLSQKRWCGCGCWNARVARCERVCVFLVHVAEEESDDPISNTAGHFVGGTGPTKREIFNWERFFAPRLRVIVIVLE